MRPAQISLTTYFVRELQFKLNDSFEPLSPWTAKLEDFEVTPTAVSKTEDRRSWELNLRLALNAPPERNCPYSFLIDLVGIVQVDQSVRDENIERLIHINGTSLVFSAAREIIRVVTSYGPHKPILLPTVTFWEPKPIPPAAPPVKASGAEVGRATTETAVGGQ